MNQEEYYYNQFTEDFDIFWNKVPHRSDYVTREPLFEFAGLVKQSDFDALEDIGQKNLIYFLSALGCTILIDQVMYTHFREHYSEFQGMTRYPKMEAGWTNANPWMVFNQNVRLSRNLHKGETSEKFSEFAEFFVSDLKEFFEKHHFSKATWKAVKEAMLNDVGVGQGEYGQIFVNKLKSVNA